MRERGSPRPAFSFGLVGWLEFVGGYGLPLQPLLRTNERRAANPTKLFPLLIQKINYCLNILSQQANQTKREGWVPSLCWLLWWRVGWLPSFGWLAPFFWWNQMKERTGPAKEEQSTRAPAAIERGEANELSEWVEWNSSQFIAERVMGAAAPFLLSFHSINQWNSRQINFLFY